MQDLLEPCCTQFDGEQFLKYNKEQQLKCLQYMLENTFAVPIQKENNEVQAILFDSPGSVDKFSHYLVNSEGFGEFEIRILNFKAFNANLEDTLYEEKLVSWYYSQINSKFTQRAPVTFQSRVFPGTRDVNKLTHMFDVQEYCGGCFLETVYAQMQQFRYIENKQHKRTENDINFDAERGSLIAHLWGMILAFFVKGKAAARAQESQRFSRASGAGSPLTLTYVLTPERRGPSPRPRASQETG